MVDAYIASYLEAGLRHWEGFFIDIASRQLLLRLQLLLITAFGELQCYYMNPLLKRYWRK